MVLSIKKHSVRFKEMFLLRYGGEKLFTITGIKLIYCVRVEIC